MLSRLNYLKIVIYFALIVLSLAIFKTWLDFSRPQNNFYALSSKKNNLLIQARDGTPLEISYQNRWNNHDNLLLHQMPELLVQAFIVSEDKRFYKHHGVDWLARVDALWNRIINKKKFRGASTITEQVVRMLHPRPRNYWSKWLEGLEAMFLELYVSKAEILEFYLNQVPYSANRHGVVQAARFYFGRDVTTLSVKEMLALAVLIKAPSKFDPYKGKIQIQYSIYRLANLLKQRDFLCKEEVDNLKNYHLQLANKTSSVNALHFINFVKKNTEYYLRKEKIISTVDNNLQYFITNLLENRLKSLAAKNVNEAAALVLDNHTGEILAWVSVGRFCKVTENQAPGCMIDMVLRPRQPGSALKPFLYAAALEKGLQASTILEDAPYFNKAGKGIKHFRNYSNIYYGKVRLRTALGSSLNIPALRVINHISPEYYLSILQNLEFHSLKESADFYDIGLSLGSGEVSLFELTRAYMMFANRGIFSSLYFTLNHKLSTKQKEKRIFSEEVASLIGNILSDPWARNLEFGHSSALNFPTQTAVKTGTTSDYRDAWAIGYNYQYTVGIWMGNANYQPMAGITGAIGSSLPLRAIFNELSRKPGTSESLFLSPKLTAKNICIDTQDTEQLLTNCLTYTEYFLPEKAALTDKNFTAAQKIRIIKPSQNFEMAFDPRIPASKQALVMQLTGIIADEDEVEWIIDGQKSTKTSGNKFLWPVIQGKHEVWVVIWRNNTIISQTEKVNFWVK